MTYRMCEAVSLVPLQFQSAKFDIRTYKIFSISMKILKWYSDSNQFIDFFKCKVIVCHLIWSVHANWWAVQLNVNSCHVCMSCWQEVKDGHAQMKTLTHLWYRELRAESAEDDTDHELEARWHLYLSPDSFVHSLMYITACSPLW